MRSSLHQRSSRPSSLVWRQSSSKRQSSFIKKKDVSESGSTYLDKLSVVDINRFCPQKIFNVLFINETDENSNKFLKNLIESSREFEEVSYLTFITYDDVKDLIENCENVVLPPSIKTILTDILQLDRDRWYNANGDMRPSLLASLIKLKLIEVMYKHYKTAVLKMQRRRKLENDLKALTNECVGAKEKPSKPTAKTSESAEITDYTSIPIDTQDDIIFDDDIHHQVAFYVFQGFYNPEILKEVIVNNFVDVVSVLRFTVLQPDEKSARDCSMFSEFWDQLDQYLYGPMRHMYFENTFVMTYTDTNNDLKETFEELLYVIRSVSDIKLNHLNYIRHMDILRVKEIYYYFPLACFNVYNNFLDKIPLELVKVPVLLDTVLKQIPVNVDEIITFSQNLKHSYLDLKLFVSSRCSDPCGIDTFFKAKIKNGLVQTFKNRVPNFLVHEGDEMTLILNSYKKHGPLVYDLTKVILKDVWPLNRFTEIDVSYTDVLHKHDVNPESKTVVQYKDALLHFLYLFLFYMFNDTEHLPKQVNTDLTKILEAYSKLDFFNRCQTKILELTEDDESQTLRSNLYDTTPGEFFWMEKLDSTVLIQEIFKAENEYLYWDQKYSPETDTLLIQFSDRLDEFGLNTKVHDVHLLTPVCLRDFCKYTIAEEADWLEKNKPSKYIRKCFVKEECLGARKVIENPIYPEYNDLLEVSPTEIDNGKSEITFEQLVEEIQNYPSSFNIYRECIRSEKPNKFLVYDFGTRYFQIKGHTSTFYSHDDVKLTVDNTTTLDEYPKCTISLESRNNSLVLHSNKFYLTEDYNFHMNLADGTILSFIFLKSIKKPKHVIKVKKLIAEDITSDQCIEDSSDVRAGTETVLSVEQNYFESILGSNLLNEEFTSSTDIHFKPPESMLERLKQAVMCNVPIYKVNSNFSHLKKLKSEFEIPLATIVKRILHNVMQVEEKHPFTKRFLAEDAQKPEEDLKFDTRIAYPNGLYVSFYPSKVTEGQLEVKQEYLCRNEQTEMEEFRLFTRGGYILIKKIDGSITILKSNGDTIQHEKLDTDSADVKHQRIKPCHRKNINDYKKRVSKLFKNHNEDMAAIAVSRRAFHQTRKGYIMNSNSTALLETNKVPYLKSSMLKFDGTRISIESGKLKIKKMLHTTVQHDFIKEEMEYERGDGLRSIINKSGKQIVEFLDGTKISSNVLVATQLVDGYVYISTEFEYRHPNYATVNYSFEGTLAVTLNDSVVFEREPDKVRVNIDDDIVTTIDKQHVHFEKTCSKCNSKYTCDISISPMVGQSNSLDDFVHASDSYNKHFYSDFQGNCRRNNDFIRTAVNAAGCNHFLSMSYKSLFVVNRDLTGCRFWTDQMVNVKKQLMEKDEYSVVNDSKDPENLKIQVLKFTRNYYEYYSNRFSFLSKNLSDPAAEPTYSKFCLVKKMLDHESLTKFCQDLRMYFEKEEESDVKFLDMVTTIAEDREVYNERMEEMFPKEITVVEEEKCVCVKHRITIADKIEKWRRECEKYKALLRSGVKPCYFKSDFCQTIKKNY